MFCTSAALPKLLRPAVNVVFYARFILFTVDEE